MPSSEEYVVITMSGFDTLIGKSLECKIKENLGEQTFQKIQNKIFEQHGIRFTHAVEDFQKLDIVLKEFFGNGAEDIEKQIINKIVTFGESGSKEKKWVTIADQNLTKIILELLVDEDNKNIINVVIDEARIIPDILHISNIPQTSGYRKIKVLIQNGMLIPHGFTTIYNGKKVNKYKSVFEKIMIEMERNKVIVRVIPTQESLKNSMMIQLVCS